MSLLKFRVKDFLGRERPPRDPDRGRPDCKPFWNPHRWTKWSEPEKETWERTNLPTNFLPSSMWTEIKGADLLKGIKTEFIRYKQTRSCVKCGIAEARYLEGE